MRVIIASSIDSPDGLQLTNIEPDDAPYAILSHTWGSDEDEVVYTDILNGKAHTRKTFETKVVYTCRRAIADRYKYAWIDTCCIDKSSSAELSEAINSMFYWYRKSAVCYVLLSDVPGDTNIDDPNSAFAKARWFTRGFTLQELLAPPDVVFYSGDWLELGTKTGLCTTLAAITKIDIDVLIGNRPIEATSIANRMGWAASRVTKRPEDIAYCLMGIFSVNMPLLYGEGSRAFIRLQEEIMKSSIDHSLFAWVDEDAPEEEMRGVLARSPSVFSKTRMISPYQPWNKQEPYVMTNMGLSIDLPVNQVTGTDGMFVACLDCPTSDLSEETFFGIFLRKMAMANDDMRFTRVKASVHCPVTVYQYSHKKHVYLNTGPSFQDTMKQPVSLFTRPLVRFDGQPSWAAHRLISMTVYPGGHQYRLDRLRHMPTWPVSTIFMRRGGKRVSCAILIREAAKHQWFLILLGSAENGHDFAYHVVNVNKDLDNERHLEDHMPDLQELELFYHEPKPIGEKYMIGNYWICLLETRHSGTDHSINVSIQRLSGPEQAELQRLNDREEAKGPTSKLRKQISRILT